MDLWHLLGGTAQLMIVSADICAVLAQLEKENVRLYRLHKLDELTLELTVTRAQLPCVLRMLEKKGAKYTVVKRRGLYWRLVGLKRRKALITGLFLLLVMQCFIQSRVLFIRVEGNGDLPAALILEKAEQFGICFGARRSEIRSEKMKNALLQALPQLQWAGINTSGCTAVISVRERSELLPVKDDSGVSCMVAGRDGVIVSCTATSGSLLCAPGQAVKAGDKLISGYTDCGLSIRAGPARGEVFARTEHQLSLIAPMELTQKGAYMRKEVNFSLIIGKKRINFFKDSRISPPSCDKMYEEKTLTLPGGFTLPVTLVKQTVVYYEQMPRPLSREELTQQMLALAQEYLLGQMIAGSIESYDYRFSDHGLALMEFQCSCTEMIGRIQKEEILTPNG